VAVTVSSPTGVLVAVHEAGLTGKVNEHSVVVVEPAVVVKVTVPVGVPVPDVGATVAP
jgi:hypothetical protein